MTKRAVVHDSGDFVAEARRRFDDGADEVIVCSEGAAIADPSVIRALLALGRMRVRVPVRTFDAELHHRLGGRAHPREIARGIARASAAGVHVDVVLEIAEGLAPIAGRLLGLARAAPRIARFLHVAVPDDLPLRDPAAIAEEIDEARAVANEVGVLLEPDGDTRVDTELEALLAGIKPVIRLSTEAEDEVAFIDRYRRFGLVACSADGTFINEDGTHSRRLRLIYVARNLEVAERVRAVEAKTFVAYSDLEVRASEYRDLGVALGYPRCCVDAYVDRVVLDPESEMGGKDLTEPYVVARGAYSEAPAWQLNHLLFETGSALVSFTPCSYRCANAMAYATAVLDRARSVSPLAEPSLRKRLAVDLVVDRRGARVPVKIEGSKIVGAQPRRTKTGALVHALDEALARAIVGEEIAAGRVPNGDANPPIVLRFRQAEGVAASAER